MLPQEPCRALHTRFTDAAPLRALQSPQYSNTDVASLRALQSPQYSIY
jgi:hypothetical protein